MRALVFNENSAVSNNKRVFGMPNRIVQPLSYSGINNPHYFFPSLSVICALQHRCDHGLCICNCMSVGWSSRAGGVKTRAQPYTPQMSHQSDRSLAHGGWWNESPYGHCSGEIDFVVQFLATAFHERLMSDLRCGGYNNRRRTLPFQFKFLRCAPNERRDRRRLGTVTVSH